MSCELEVVKDPYESTGLQPAERPQGLGSSGTLQLCLCGCILTLKKQSSLLVRTKKEGLARKSWLHTKWLGWWVGIWHFILVWKSHFFFEQKNSQCFRLKECGVKILALFIQETAGGTIFFFGGGLEMLEVMTTGWISVWICAVFFPCKTNWE